MADATAGHGARPDEPRCYNCGGYGHWAVGCPEPTRENPAGLSWRDASNPKQGNNNRGQNNGGRKSKGPIITKYTPPSTSYSGSYYPPPPGYSHQQPSYPGPPGSAHQPPYSHYPPQGHHQPSHPAPPPPPLPSAPGYPPHPTYHSQPYPPTHYTPPPPTPPSYGGPHSHRHAGPPAQYPPPASYSQYAPPPPPREHHASQPPRPAYAGSFPRVPPQNSPPSHTKAGSGKHSRGNHQDKNPKQGSKTTLPAAAPGPVIHGLPPKPPKSIHELPDPVGENRNKRKNDRGNRNNRDNRDNRNKDNRAARQNSKSNQGGGGGGRRRESAAGSSDQRNNQDRRKHQRNLSGDKAKITGNDAGSPTTDIATLDKPAASIPHEQNDIKDANAHSSQASVTASGTHVAHDVASIVVAEDKDSGQLVINKAEAESTQQQDVPTKKQKEVQDTASPNIVESDASAGDQVSPALLESPKLTRPSREDGQSQDLAQDPGPSLHNRNGSQDHSEKSLKRQRVEKWRHSGEAGESDQNDEEPSQRSPNRSRPLGRRSSPSGSQRSRASSVSSRSSDLNSLEAELLGLPPRRRSSAASGSKRKMDTNHAASKPKKRKQTDSAYSRRW